MDPKAWCLTIAMFGSSGESCSPMQQTFVDSELKRFRG